uniref:Uncharacterized protein n=1 Tax=uncultured Armatimonadetes bacterium TaxID=157466 RepID=A0A6J4HXZ9_9BACT|nr:hypothetical protein AVDCRST_MAG63-1255 [uncultured Armatimonadetes bacterium]
MRSPREVALCAWFVLTALAFWGPYGGLRVPETVVLYGVFLLTFVATLVLRLMKARGAAPREREEAGG